MSNNINEIDEDLEIWLKQTELDLTDLDNNQNIKTNFMFCQRNFQRLKSWLLMLLKFVKYLRNLLNIDKLLNELFRRLQEEKITIPILNSMNIGTQTTYKEPIFDTDYIINRLDLNTIEITAKKDNWKVDKLMVTVKDMEGIINYPVIKTSNNRITIFFPDGIYTNYQVMFI